MGRATTSLRASQIKVYGYAYDLDTGLLTQVAAPTFAAATA